MATKIIFYLLFVLDLALTALLGWSLWQTHLVPSTAALIAVGALALILLLLFLLQREGKGKKKKSKTGFRIAAIVILLFLGLVEGAVSYYVMHYQKSVSKITDVHTQVTQVEVYVRKADEVDSVEEAVERQFRFGVIAGADEEAVAQTRSEIEEKCGQSLDMESYPNLLELVKAISEEKVDALILSSAFFELIDSLEGYESVKDALKPVHTSNVETEIVQETLQDTFQESLQESTPGTFSEGTGSVQPMKDPDLWEHSFCAYVSGIDTFGPITARSRSDVNILAIVNTSTKTVLLVSTPRDYYVPFNFAPVNGAMDKLTHAGIYGIDASMKALSDLYGLPVHYYVRVNFSGFINVIDTLGGVDVESDADFGNTKYSYHKGMNHLGGEAALRFVRDRYSFADGDRARSRHQMAVIKGVINGLRSSKIITNYASLMEDMEGCFQTNASMAMIGDLVQLTLDPSTSDWKVLTYNVDGNGRLDEAYSLGMKAYCMHPNMKTVEYAQSLVAKVLAGEPLTQEELQKNAPSPRGDK